MLLNSDYLIDVIIFCTHWFLLQLLKQKYKPRRCETKPKINVNPKRFD